MATNRESGFGRREFIGAAAAALFAGVVIQITGCGEDSATSSGGAGDIVGSISDNHPTPHSAVVTKAQIDAGGDVTLDIQGAANHNHTVSLPAANMATLKAKGHVMVTSSDGGTETHSHIIMFN
jgi:hypothetical protein